MSKENRQIPYGESWTCTDGVCCTDERCEEWTWRAAMITVVACILVVVVFVIETFT